MWWRAFVLYVFAAYVKCQNQPEQIHLSLGDKPDEMVITWTTLQHAKDTVVNYGLQKPDNIVFGSQKPFIDGGSEQRTIYMHVVKLKNLKANTSYVYTAGSDSSVVNTDMKFWSQIYSFKTLPSGTEWMMKVVMLGDLGAENGRSIPHLTREVGEGALHMVLHNGDFAYDFDTEEGKTGDLFMNLMQPIAAYVPYMTAVGNHESAYNFSHYKYRFNMPGSTDNMYYSFNVGPVHFVAYASDFYYFTSFGTEQIMHQYAWLEKDLTEANKEENRKKQPWIIAFSHRPMYCSNSNDNEHCSMADNKIRVGFPIYSYFEKQFVLGLEDLFYKQGVDIVFAAHEHSYERMWPVYQLNVCNGSIKDPYKDPPAPVHIVSGSAGNKENEDPFDKIPHPWSAFRSDDYGYTRISAYNATTLYMEQVSVEKEELEIIDRVTITKTALRPNFHCKTNKANSFKQWQYMTAKEAYMDIFMAMSVKGTDK